MTISLVKAIQDRFGNALQAAYVTVYKTGSTELARLYASDGVEQLGNPTFTDAYGMLSVKIDAGEYDIRETRGKYPERKTLNFSCWLVRGGTPIGGAAANDQISIGIGGGDINGSGAFITQAGYDDVINIIHSSPNALIRINADSGAWQDYLNSNTINPSYAVSIGHSGPGGAYNFGVTMAAFHANVHSYTEYTTIIDFNGYVGIYAIGFMKTKLLLFGSGSPNGSAVAGKSAIYQRLDGSAGSLLYVKTSASGNTGWTAFA